MTRKDIKKTKCWVPLLESGFSLLPMKFNNRTHYGAFYYNKEKRIEILPKVGTNIWVITIFTDANCSQYFVNSMQILNTIKNERENIENNN